MRERNVLLSDFSLARIYLNLVRGVGFEPCPNWRYLPSLSSFLWERLNPQLFGGESCARSALLQRLLIERLAYELKSQQAGHTDIAFLSIASAVTTILLSREPQKMDLYPGIAPPIRVCVLTNAECSREAG